MTTQLQQIWRASQQAIVATASYLNRTRLIRRRHGTKVFGIGFPKTGTTTLGACFRELGYLHQACDMRLAAQVVNDKLDDAFRVADRCDRFEDWPWFRHYRQLDARSGRPGIPRFPTAARVTASAGQP